MTRLKPPFFLRNLIVLLILGVVLVLSGSANLTTGIGLVPNVTPVRLFPGETGSYFLTVHNGQGRSVTVTFSVSVVSPPASSDLTLTFPSTVVTKPGNTRVTVIVTAHPDAAPGAYVLKNSISL